MTIVSGCVAAAVLSGCASHQPQAAVTDDPKPRPTEPGLSGAALRSIAGQLRQSLPCGDADALADDLAFWDAMRGFDCFDGTDSVFVRVYAHAASVSQTLDEWKDTVNAQRAVTRGENWYVIGPPSVIAAVTAPEGSPAIADDVGVPTKLTAAQDYLTTCTRFVASEGERYVKHPRKRSGSAKQYEALFPGVTAAVHASVDHLGRARIRQIADEERWVAALSPIGPHLKARCATAYEKVRDTVSPLEEAR
ncbi:hypothetical protein ACLBWP_04755 [Microbacterium sp. M1A1_1b]